MNLGVIAVSIPRRVSLLLVPLLVLAVSVTGCGGAAKKPKKGKTAKTATAEKTIVPAEVDAAAAVTVDERRITVAPPVDWKREPRSKDYLARYVPGGRRTSLSVTVLGGDPPAGITAVDAANHADFVAAVAELLAGEFTDAEGRSTLSKKPAAVDLGPHKAVVWEAPGKATVDGRSQPVQRSCAAVVVAGRMYTVEARAPKGGLDDTGRAAARGVAAGIAPAAAPEKPKPEPEPSAKPEEPAEPAAPAAE